MTLTRRGFLGLAALPLAAIATRSGAAGDDFPNHPLRLVIPFSAGGSPDLIGRVVADQLSKQIGQAIVIENKLGANGIIAENAVANAAPDGYTLLLNTGSQVINPSIYAKLPFDTFRDFAPVSLLTVAPALILVVNPSFPATDIQQFLAMARKSDSRVSFGSPGIGNTLHLAGELLNEKAGIRMLHVPFKGAAPALNAVIAGDVSACFLSTTAASIAVKAKQVRPLAVTSAKRIASFPDVPSLAEAGVTGIDYNGGWMAIFAPAKTPSAIVQMLSAGFARAMAHPEVRERMLQWDSPPAGSTPEELGRFVQAEYARFARIIKQANIPPQAT